jgi:hypothetical protein
MPRHILVLSASVGAGHLRAAEAVEMALRELDPSAVVQNLDVLQLTNAAFRQFYGRAYLDLVNRAPHMLGYFYDLMDRPPGAPCRRRLSARRSRPRPRRAGRACGSPDRKAGGGFDSRFARCQGPAHVHPKLPCVLSRLDFHRRDQLTANDPAYCVALPALSIAVIR